MHNNYDVETFNKALKYLNQKKAEKAAPLFKKLIKQFPHKEAYLNLGNCYRLLGDDILARDNYLKAADPNIPMSDCTFHREYPIAVNNLGLLAYTYENDDLAREMYLRAIKAAPEYFDAQWNMGNVLLRQYCSRKYDNPILAWRLYEARFKQSNKTRLRNTKTDLISWDGFDPVDSIVVLAEQGIGDMVMFARYIKLIPAKKIWVQCDPKLDYLFNEWPTCRDPIETDATHGVPMCNLPMIFAPKIPEAEWLKHKFIPKLPNGSLDIGCVWSGSPTHSNNKYRSTTPDKFRNFSKYGTLYTLNPPEHGTPGFMPLNTSSWKHTLEALSKLDLVITVDTSIAHICGSVGMECWVIMPWKESDFRWGDKSMGFDNIWYPSVKVIRNNCNWDDSFRLVEILLDEKRTK